MVRVAGIRNLEEKISIVEAKLEAVSYLPCFAGAGNREPRTLTKNEKFISMYIRHSKRMLYFAKKCLKEYLEVLSEADRIFQYSPNESGIVFPIQREDFFYLIDAMIIFAHSLIEEKQMNKIKELADGTILNSYKSYKEEIKNWLYTDKIILLRNEIIHLKGLGAHWGNAIHAEKTKIGEIVLKIHSSPVFDDKERKYYFFDLACWPLLILGKMLHHIELMAHIFRDQVIRDSKSSPASQKLYVNPGYTVLLPDLIVEKALFNASSKIETFEEK